MERLRVRLRGLVDGLWFIPSLLAVGLGGLSFALIRLDEHVDWQRSAWVFAGSAGAARTVLTTIAGSLITVAGLTFSVTMIVLQLASSQFSPRVVNNFLRDRFTQMTVGVFVGIFIYCLIGLRSVGGSAEFVPRLTVTIASALGVVAVILLIAFIHHVSTLIQVSHVAARIGRETLRALDRVYPDTFGDAAATTDTALVVAGWRNDGSCATVYSSRPGFVQRVDVDRLVSAVCRSPARIHVAVAPGDFVSGEQPVLEIWPPEAVGDGEPLREAVVVGDERDLSQDASFGVRQLTDIALRAISPGVNDPTTAVTCIGYIRSALERLAGRELPPGVRRYERPDVAVAARRVEYREYVESLAEIGRHAGGDARVARQLLRACEAARESALRAASNEFAATVNEIAVAISAQAVAEAKNERDRALIRELVDRMTA